MLRFLNISGKEILFSKKFDFFQHIERVIRFTNISYFFQWHIFQIIEGVAFYKARYLLTIVVGHCTDNNNFTDHTINKQVLKKNTNNPKFQHLWCCLSLLKSRSDLRQIHRYVTLLLNSNFLSPTNLFLSMSNNSILDHGLWPNHKPKNALQVMDNRVHIFLMTLSQTT